MKKPARQKNPPSFASMFSGCGGFDTGFKGAGFAPLAGFDIDPEAVARFTHNLGHPATLADLSENPAIVANLRPDVVIAGPPCQGFSTAGRRELDDSRNHLLPLAGEMAVRMKPRAIVIENVAAAKSGEHRVWWTRLEAGLRDAGYKTSTQLWNAADIGMAQSRRRLLLFAWKGKRDPIFQHGVEAKATLADVLAGVEHQQDHCPQPLAPETRLYQIATRIGPGQKLSNVRGGPRSVHTWHIPEVFGPTTARECQLLEFIMRVRRQERVRETGDADAVSLSRLTREFGRGIETTVRRLKSKGYLRDKDDGLDLAHSFNGKCRRFRWDDISCAVDTRFGDPHLVLHPNENRPFTVREAARIQGFPDSFRFNGDPKSMFRLIGNAVPPPLARRAAEALLPLFQHP